MEPTFADMDTKDVESNASYYRIRFLKERLPSNLQILLRVIFMNLMRSRMDTIEHIASMMLIMSCESEDAQRNDISVGRK